MYVLIVTFSLLIATASAEAGTDLPASCDMAPENQRFLEDAIASWEAVSTRHLHLDNSRLPRIVVFGTHCQWDLLTEEDGSGNSELQIRGRSLSSVSRPHQGEIHLPNGMTQPANGLAFASLYDGGQKTFFVMALPDVWRLNPKAAAHPDLIGLLLGIINHEIVHTIHLVQAARIIDRVVKEHSISGMAINDDLVETIFSQNDEFSAAYAAERDLYYEAAREEDAERMRQLVKAALQTTRERQARYFTGEYAAFATLEEVFLNMEGVATWAAHKVSGDQLIERAHNSWSQDFGFVLYLLIDRLVPDWQPSALGPELVSPFAMLEEITVDQPE